ncbi:GLPGLI family protein [Elizabethkingia meningoseptica]|uniref:GLPGLI family protein n=1 Tax=Elizabethkingia meningoseptica TaxID=238 RepID=UPI00099A0A70|nr:GLPGLI family protein [Elizabethkingia meningoseptica]
MKLYLFFFIILYYSYPAQMQTFVYHLQYKQGIEKSTVLEKKILLDISGRSSVFRTPFEKKSDSLIYNGKFGLSSSYGFEEQLYISKNLNTNEVLRQVRNLFGFYSIKIEELLHWKILPDKSKIGDYDVQKAEVNYGGRTWIAWFTTEIPVYEGPYVFCGLPGLIVKIADDQDDYIFSLTEVKAFNGHLYPRKKGIVMDFPTFRKFSMNYYSDPFAEAKARNMPMAKEGENGNIVRATHKEMNEMAQKSIRERGSNPIELNYRNDYK